MRWLVVVACACSAKPAPKHRDDAAPVGHQTDAQLALPDATTIAENNPNWKISYDFDGDHVPDAITTTYSGGAHCCYKVSVGLSKSRQVIDLPFELDGGYPNGLDLSRPSFAIEVGADRVASFRMEIARYGVDYEPIPLAWAKTYGIRSHSIRVGLRDGRVHVENMIWACDAAIESLGRFAFSKWEGLPPCRLSDLPVDRSAGLDRELGTAHRLRSTERTVDLALGRGSEITFTLDTLDLVRADFDTTNTDFEATTKAERRR